MRVSGAETTPPELVQFAEALESLGEVIVAAGSEALHAHARATHNVPLGAISYALGATGALPPVADAARFGDIVDALALLTEHAAHLPLDYVCALATERESPAVAGMAAALGADHRRGGVHVQALRIAFRISALDFALLATGDREALGRALGVPESDIDTALASIRDID